MKILAISGSLRAASTNSALCRAFARLAPKPLQVTVFTAVGRLPLFNPDLEADPPPSVQEFRTAVAQANALLLASPEYAHGISGAMKNALDWLVSFEGFINKPVAAINTSPRAQHAYASLKEILQTMSASILPEASASIPLLSKCITEEAMLDSPEVRKKIQSALSALAASLSGTAAVNPTSPFVANDI
jgi:chromate reductase, NAD(P)H dehydrogenase (quinone)